MFGYSTRDKVADILTTFCKTYEHEVCFYDNAIGVNSFMNKVVSTKTWINEIPTEYKDEAYMALRKSIEYLWSCADEL